MKHILVLCTCFFACDEGLPRTLGLDEPIRVHGAQFIPGTLPGTPPDGGSATPTITSYVVADPTVLPGQANKSISGRASGDATAVALRFLDMGSGYWLVPTGPVDSQYQGEFTWTATSDFNPLAANSPGVHPVRLVAFDMNGNAGAQVEFNLCLEPAVPDNGATCNSSKTAPAAVISLSWDAPVDIDLVIVDPDGTITDAKNPATIPVDAGVLDPTAGVIDRDSLAGCVEDSLRREDIVWQNAPPSGSTFDVYANLFSACGQSGAAFVATAYTSTNGTLVAGQTAKGVFTSYDANGGAALGTYLFSFSFP